MTSYLFPADANKLKRLKFVFRVELLYASRHGVVETIGEGKAIAIWLPPGRTEGAFTAMVQSGAILAPLRLGLKAAWRVILLLRSIQELRLRLVSGDHWYLLGLGVHPQHQGQGWGSELVQHGLARAQSVDLPCYLETTNQRNIVFYQRNGFRLVGDRPIARGGPTAWGMLCPSAARLDLLTTHASGKEVRKLGSPSGKGLSRCIVTISSQPPAPALRPAPNKAPWRSGDSTRVYDLAAQYRTAAV